MQRTRDNSHPNTKIGTFVLVFGLLLSAAFLVGLDRCSGADAANPPDLPSSAPEETLPVSLGTGPGSEPGRQIAPPKASREILRIRVVDDESLMGIPGAVLRRGPLKRKVDARLLTVIAQGSPDGVIEATPDAVACGSSEGLQVACPGYASAWILESELLPDLETIVRLRPGATVTVRAVDRTSRLPVSGAVIALMQGESPIPLRDLWNPDEATILELMNSESFLPGSYLAFATADESGSVVFRSVPPGEYHVAAFKYGMWTAPSSSIMDPLPILRVSMSREILMLDIEMAAILLAVAVPDSELDVVAVDGTANGVDFGFLNLKEVLDADVQSRFPKSIFSCYTLSSATNPSATVLVFAEGFGWISSDLVFDAFHDCRATVVSAPAGVRGVASGRVRVDFLAPDGSQLSLSTCLLKGIGNPDVRIQVGAEARVPPGRYQATPLSAPWLLQEIPHEEFEVRSGAMIHRTITASKGANRFGLEMTTIDGDPVPSIVVHAHNVKSRARIVKFTTTKQQLHILLPWGPVAEDYEIVASSFDLRGSATVTTGGATMPAEPLVVRIQLAPRTRRR